LIFSKAHVLQFSARRLLGFPFFKDGFKIPQI